jgi:hypothetical protein
MALLFYLLSKYFSLLREEPDGLGGPSLLAGDQSLQVLHGIFELLHLMKLRSLIRGQVKLVKTLEK